LTDNPFMIRLKSLIDILTNGNKKRFAEMLGIGPSHINDWTNVGCVPNAFYLAIMHGKTGVNLHWLLNNEGEMFVKSKSPLAVSRVGYAHQKEQPSMVRKALEEYGYDKEEREYIDKLITIFRTKDAGTKSAIIQNIDTFLRVPAAEKAKKTKAG